MWMFLENFNFAYGEFDNLLFDYNFLSQCKFYYLDSF